MRDSSSSTTTELAPWCTFLKRHVPMRLRPTECGLCIYMRLRSRNEPLAPLLTQCREALLLLHALAVVDNSAFQDFLLACWCENLPLVVPGVLPARFELRLGDSKDATLGFDTQLYREFFALPSERDDRSASSSATQSTAFSAAMDAILANAPTLLSPCVVRLRFIPRRTLEPKRVVPYLTSVNDLLRELQQAIDQAEPSSHPVHTSLLTFPFSLETLELHASRLPLPPGASAALVQLLELERPRVKLYPFVDLSTAGKIASAPLAERGHVFRALTGCWGLPSRPSTSSSRDNEAYAKTTAPLNAMGITNERDVGSTAEGREYLQTVRAMCSALVASQKINCLTLSTTRTRRRECWQWLAYALLSKDSIATVSRLVIDDERFRRKDMRAILRILDATNPAAVLWKAQRRAEELEALEGEPDDDNDHNDEEERHGVHDQLDVNTVLMNHLNGENDDVVVLPGGDNDSDDDQSEYSDDEESEASDDEDEEDSREQSPISASLKPGTVVQTYGTSPTSITLDTSAPVRVMHDDDSADARAVTVLVPGVGPCSAQRVSIERVIPSESSSTLSSRALGYRGAITSLSLCCTFPVTGTAVLPLIQYLGPQLTTLELFPDIHISAVRLREILLACPRLTQFAIPGMRDSAELELLAMYEAQQCRISDLQLLSLRPSDGTEELIRRLSGAAHRISKCVRHFTLVPCSLRPLPNSMSALLVEMLQRNKTLESFQVQLSREGFETLERDLMRFHGKCLPVVKTPVPLASRLAFLSVLQAFGGATPSAKRAAHQDACSDPSDSRPLKRVRREGIAALDLKRFDTHLIALIFGFAAEPRVREIHISCL